MISFKANGQLVAALVVLVDAVLGVLYVIGVIHTKPDESIVVIAVTSAFNIAGYIWALIQHQQHTLAMRLGLLPFQQQAGAAAAPPSMQTRKR